MKRLTERYSETEKPDGESDVWVRNHDYTMAAERLADYEDTGLTPQGVLELKERDTAKAPEEFDVHWYKCPTCGKYAGGLKGNFCHVCGQRLKWED